jgi:hypothetical protein
MVIPTTHVVEPIPWDRVCEISQFGTKIPIDLARFV